MGAHVGGANTGNIGVCVLGCYHPPETSWPCYDEMTYATKNLLYIYIHGLRIRMVLIQTF